MGAGETIDRIAICTVGELFGGVERHVLGLIKGLKSHRVRVALILLHDGELAAQARLLGTDPMIFPGRNLAVFDTARRLAQILEHQQINLVHVHGYKATVFCALARRWNRFAMVKTEHGLPEPTTGGWFRTWRSSVYHLLDRIATRATCATVCYVTEDLRSHYRRAHRGLQTAMIPNGVESMQRHQFRRPPELEPDRFNLLIVGRLDPVKGHQLAIEALASNKIPQDVHLHILGEGPCQHELVAFADACGVANRVHLLGYRRNIYDYMSNCNGLLMPSLHEGLPYTLLEGMALGIPVIASRVGGLAEVIQNGITGILVSRGSVPELAEAISHFRQDPALFATFGDAARRLQESRYSLEAMTAAYLQVYRNTGLATV